MEDTALAPFVIADSVVGEVALCYGAKYGTRADADWLGRRAERIYAKNEKFRKMMRRKDPRGLLYNFMLTWHASRIKRRDARIGYEVGAAGWRGTPLVCKR